MTSGIYMIRNPLTGECLYIGQTQDFEKRFKQHLSTLRTGRSLKAFKSWLDASSIEASDLEFIPLITEVLTEEARNYLEMQMFQVYKPQFYGKRPSMNEHWEMSENTKRKISEGLARNHSPVRVECASCGVEFIQQRLKYKFCTKQCAVNNTRAKTSVCPDCGTSTTSRGVGLPGTRCRRCVGPDRKVSKLEPYRAYLTSEIADGRSINSLAQELNVGYSTLHGYLSRRHIIK